MTKFYGRRILPMKDGPERKMMTLFLERIKQIKGLTSFITKTGRINGKWLNVSMAYDFPSGRLLRIIYCKAKHQGREEFMKDVYRFVDILFALIAKEDRQSRMEHQ